MKPTSNLHPKVLSLMAQNLRGVYGNGFTRINALT